MNHYDDLDFYVRIWGINCSEKKTAAQLCWEMAVAWKKKTIWTLFSVVFSEEEDFICWPIIKSEEKKGKQKPTRMDYYLDFYVRIWTTHKQIWQYKGEKYGYKKMAGLNF